MTGAVPLAEVIRSGFVEGVHRGSVVVLDGGGAVLDSAGDVKSPIFPRSSSKPLQAIGMLRSGLRLVDPADLALICASHFGEDHHVARVRALLRSAGLDESALRCPPDLPLHQPTAEAVLRAGGGRSRVQMNCSGKHTGMLLTCLASGWSTEEYWLAEHPLQVRIQATVEEFTGEPAAAVGVDGCGAPVLAASLVGLASAFLRLVSGAPGSVERTVADAMRSNPEVVAGSGAEDTRIMQAVPGLLSKGGAEGVAAVAIPDVGAVALKIEDGGMRARPPVLASALRRLGVEVPKGLAEVPVLGGGEAVGAVRASW
ncbi:asparaginase [Phytohabitans houttuyneae]|uniref:Asparaginase n=1 Tax=Phytohabitans houttuyneae TaxID=1076126 RepID=A0A6V8KHX6_9ACTN|nr:asparaginase [Phytohabitans houttuyneae]GFJ80325.1 asparaginase [Phytohabitans houttuyneae]